MTLERCPHCVAALAGYTNGFGGVYLQCLDCGYYEAVRQIPSPFPDRKYRATYRDGRTRNRRYPVVVPGGSVRRTRPA